MLFSLFIYFLASLTFTKVAYDAAFSRYDPPVQVSALPELRQQRQSLRFPSGDNLLQGYLYEGSREALVVVVPGYCSGADDYLQQIRSLQDYGWGVCAFDPTGSCASGGDSAVGFSQTLCDLDAALDWLETRGRFGYEKLLLFGHSRGGYAVCCALALEHEVAAVVSVSGVNSAMEGVLCPVVDRLGPAAWAGYPLIWMYQTTLFDKSVLEASAARALQETQVPVLLVHGSEDGVIPMEAFSVVAHREEITNPRVRYRICTDPGQNGHTDLLFDADGSANDALMEEINAFYARAAGTTDEREKNDGNCSTDPGLQAG